MRPDERKIPTMADISNTLKKVGKPGEKHKEKEEAVKELFNSRHIAGVNAQGIAVWEDLTSYPEF